ncbi:Amino acid permease [Oryctes borbonicus]|uniref:Amino acid permease n=1 Tax=Oryctes borbonicus TaxID=1629725 RepID=A0A0T6B4D0_9SCAR|nr:Amino acid permease [Oryctes borbonicus]
MENCFKTLARKKNFSADETTKLKRVLGIWDLTFLGLGVTLGLGTYVLAGSVAKNHAGPAVCVSFLIAAIASAVAGLCYAEFACRVPKAGSAYIYSYVTMGEFVAFIIGWNLVLEYVIGTAGLARGLSDYINALSNNVIANALRDAMPINVDFLSSYPDFLSLLIMIVLIVVMSNGAKESSMLNSVLTTANILLVVIIVGFGSTVVNVDYWKIAKEDIPKNITHGGEGGFLPFGIAGVLSGAAQCFFAFVGFDAVATTADEAKNPKKIIPLAIILCLLVSFLAYFGVSTILTLMLPYYDQDEKAPFPYVFEKVNWPTAKWIATAGAIFAITSTLVGNMFALPRILYSMASDGLLYKKLSLVSERTKTPLVATAVTGIAAGIMAMIFDIKQLVEMLSIGTLVAYTIVSLCVLILRYRPEDQNNCPNLELQSEQQNILKGVFNIFKKIFNLNGNKYADKFTNVIANWSISVFCTLSIVVVVCMKFEYFVSLKHPFHLAIFIFLVVILVLSILVIARQPQERSDLAFKVPLVPLIPCSSIFINVILMSTSQLHTYIRLIAWLAIGLAIYFSYGLWHSEERKKQKENNSETSVGQVIDRPTLTTKL